MKNLRKDEDAQALVEFTLIFPILILLILGMIEFGWLLNAKVTLNSAAREGARVAAVLNTTDAERKTQALDAAAGTIDLSGMALRNDSCNVTEEDDYVNNVHNVVVELEADIKPIIGLYVNKDNVTMTAIVRMRRE